MTDDNFSCFRCPKCHTEIQATADMIGLAAECPACGEKMTIPDCRADSVLRHVKGDDDPDTIQAMKRRTIRIELEDDL